MEKQAYSVGSRVEKLCAVCKKECGHLVAAITKLGRISRVVCVHCNTRSSFKRDDKVIKQNISAASCAPYDRTRTYRPGQLMMHSSYGLGEIITVIEPKKIDVLFSDRVRRLIHAQT